MATTKPANTAYFTATFEDPHHALVAVKHLRSRNVKVLDTYSPFPIHGMDDALGLGHSKITYACGIFAALGLICAAALQYWTSVVDYPLNIGGKPLNSVPAFIPVAFELTVLFAGLGTVATLLFLSRLRPKFKVPNLFHGVNDNRFVILGEVPAGLNYFQIQEEMMGKSALMVERYFTPDNTPNPFWTKTATLPQVAAAVLLPPAILVVAGLAVSRDFTKRVMFFDAGMWNAESAQAFDPSEVLPKGQVLQLPPQGTMARNQHLPLKFAPGKEEAERAGAELKNPVPATPQNAARGAVVWNRVCATCHGDGGKGDGGVIPRFPNPPNLLIPKYQDYPEGRLFHVATFGGPEKIMKGFGDMLTEEDRWRAVAHLRTLQVEAAKAKAAQAAKAAAAAPAPAAPAPAAPAPTAAPAAPGVKP
jgi:mono/diheme cytochrome c family protein